MTRKHFIFIADVLRDIREPLSKEKFDDCWMLVVLAFKAALARQFGNFDQDKFLRYIQKEKR